MARSISKDRLTLRILELVGKETIQSLIAKELAISPQRLNKRIKTLKEHGFITIVVSNRGETESLTPSGASLLAELSGSWGSHKVDNKVDKLQPPPPNKNPTKRLIMGLKYRLRTQLSYKEPVSYYRQEINAGQAKPVELNNSSQVVARAKLTMKLTHKNLILYSPELYSSRGELSISIEAEAKRILDNEALKFEADKNISLVRTKGGSLYSEAIQEEIADERHPLAKATPEGISKIVLARSHEDGKEMLIVDSSKKTFKELETVHNKSSGEDSDKIDEQFGGILNGDIDLRDLNQAKEVVMELVRNAVEERKNDRRLREDFKEIKDDIHYVAKNARSHAELIKEAKIILHKVNQKKLYEFV